MPPRKRNKLQVKKEEELFSTPPPFEEEEDIKPKLELLYSTPDNNNDDIKPFIKQQEQKPQLIKSKEELPELQESPSNRGIKRLAEDELDLEPLIPLYYSDLDLNQQQQLQPQQESASYVSEPVIVKPATTHRLVYWDPAVNVSILKFEPLFSDLLYFPFVPILLIPLPTLELIIFLLTFSFVLLELLEKFTNSTINGLNLLIDKIQLIEMVTLYTFFQSIKFNKQHGI